MSNPPCLRTLLACLLFLMACGGGGGGGGSTRNSNGPDATPTLLAATLIRSGSTTAAGDRLLLILSEELSLPGGVLDDSDLVISGGTLGKVSVAPTLRNTRTLEVVLGAGVSLTPGSTTIDFAATTDAVTDTTGNMPESAVARPVEDGDGDDPTIAALTTSGVDSTSNGSGSAGGSLQLPPSGFSIDISHSDASSTVTGSRTIVTCSNSVTVNGEAIQAGVDLGGSLSASSTATDTVLTVPANVVFADGSNQLTVFVRDSSGMISQPRSFEFLTRQATDAVRPFETSTHASQVWYLDFGRDVESYSVNVFNFVTPIEVTSTSNGRSDIEDLLLVLGLISSTPIANISNGQDSNEFVLARLKSEILQELQSLHPGVNITFTLQAPGTFPANRSTFPYAGIGFSQICIAGADSAAGNQGTLGVAMFDPNNKNQNNNCLISYQGSRLGVFLHTIINEGFRSHPTTTFRVTYDDFSLARFGSPIGQTSNDDKRLLGTLNDGRTQKIDLAIRRLARFTAVITAHECGHSVGLVANGAMPNGLFGNEATNFPVYPTTAADGHIKMPSSLFPGSAENIMSPAFDFEAGIDAGTRFNTLNLAYLREQVIHND